MGLCLLLVYALATPRGSAPVVAVTSADGSEGLTLTLGLLEARRAERAGSVVAIVSSKTSAGSKLLAGAGAVLREQPRTGRPPRSLFAGAAWAFFLAPLTSDRLLRTTALITSAVAAGVPNALLLSVVDGSPPHGADNTTSIGSYFALEDRLRARWHGGGFAVLRTFFYQQNLLLWARDAVATNKLRLPLSATAGCFAPLFETDVARAVAAITAQPSRPEFAGVVFNLTGPTSFTGDELAAVAANSTGNHRITFADITPAATATVLDAAGANLTQSEIRLIVGLVTLQTTGCGRFPSPDLTKLTGAPGTEISVFFAANKIAFGG